MIRSIGQGSPAPVGAPDQPRRLAAKLKFQHLELLIALQKAGSLHGAARVMHLTQSSLSKALAQIEDAFNCPLFIREARGIRPTATGAIVIEGAARMLRELAHVEAESAATDATRILRIGALPFVASAHLPLMLARLGLTQSGLRVQLTEAAAPNLVQALLAGDLDVLLTSHAYEMIDLPEGELCYEALLDSEYVVICGPANPLAASAAVTWQQLFHEHWILPAPGSMMRRLVDEAFIRAGLLTPVPLIEFSGPVTNLQMVAAGLGVSVVPALLLHYAERAGDVARLRVVQPLPRLPIGLAYRKIHASDPRLQLMRQAAQLA